MPPARAMTMPNARTMASIAPSRPARGLAVIQVVRRCHGTSAPAGLRGARALAGVKRRGGYSWATNPVRRSSSACAAAVGSVLRARRDDYDGGDDRPSADRYALRSPDPGAAQVGGGWDAPAPGDRRGRRRRGLVGRAHGARGGGRGAGAGG